MVFFTFSMQRYELFCNFGFTEVTFCSELKRKIVFSYNSLTYFVTLHRYDNNFLSKAW